MTFPVPGGTAASSKHHYGLYIRHW